MLDVVYVHEQKRSNEIEFSLKSLKNVEHRNVYIIGDDPEIKGIDYIHVPHKKHKWANESQYADQISKYLQACEMEELSDDFLAMNDDFFILHEWKPINYSNGKLLDRLIQRSISDTYDRSLRATDRLLRKNVTERINFELHTPFLFNKNKLKWLIEALNDHNLQIRSLYGNFYNIETKYMSDVKDVEDFHRRTLLSTSPSSFDNGAIGEYIRGHLS